MKNEIRLFKLQKSISGSFVHFQIDSYTFFPQHCLEASGDTIFHPVDQHQLKQIALFASSLHVKFFTQVSKIPTTSNLRIG